MRVCQGLLKEFLIKSHHYCKYPPVAETGQKAEVPRIFPENVLFRPGSLHPLLIEGYHMQADLGGQWTSRSLPPRSSNRSSGFHEAGPGGRVQSYIPGT